MAITIADLTTNISTTTDGTYVVTGDGVFDDLMEAMNAHIDAQYKLGRLTGTDYATVYVGALQSAVQQAVAFLNAQAGIANADARTTAEVDLLEQKAITEFAQTDQTTKVSAATDSILGKQAELYAEQAKGFKWNADQKYLKTLMDAWSINISTAGVAATAITALNATGTDNMNDQIAAAKPTG